MKYLFCSYPYCDQPFKYQIFLFFSQPNDYSFGFEKQLTHDHVDRGKSLNLFSQLLCYFNAYTFYENILMLTMVASYMNRLYLDMMKCLYQILTHTKDESLSLFL